MSKPIDINKPMKCSFLRFYTFSIKSLFYPEKNTFLSLYFLLMLTNRNVKTCIYLWF